ncbi:MAG: histidine phosphatase family protein [Candidatus Roizmanbacteria bacterium]|nr:MAG: histidine phosphatase family protein [Candidatus Roizmanbacteria bacterium]
MKGNQLTTFYIVRHGQTEWNVLHKIQGHLDSPLTKQGKQEAKQTAQKLKDVHFDAVYSSDLLRAKHTAKIIALEKKLEVMTSKALRERTFGEHDGSMGNEYTEKTKHLLEKYKKLATDQKWKFKFAKGYESDEGLVIRFITFLREIAIAYQGKTILIVTHGGNIRTFLTKLGYAEHGKLTPGTFKNAGYIIIESDGVDFFLKEVEGIDYI